MVWPGSRSKSDKYKEMPATPFFFNPKAVRDFRSAGDSNQDFARGGNRCRAALVVVLLLLVCAAVVLFVVAQTSA